jgi:predicted DsbA family dithiol-disulfide isomerase
VDKREFYKDKFGDDPARITAMHNRLSSIGTQNGIKFSFGGRIGNTRDSHRLIDLAKSKGLETQTKVVEQLFEGYFEKEKDITDHQVLQEAGVSAGIPETEVRRLLESDERGAEVDKELQRARHNLVTGVPNFVLQGKFEIQGAQEAEGFRRVFEKIKEIES